MTLNARDNVSSSAKSLFFYASGGSLSLYQQCACQDRLLTAHISKGRMNIAIKLVFRTNVLRAQMRRCKHMSDFGLRALVVRYCVLYSLFD